MSSLAVENPLKERTIQKIEDAKKRQSIDKHAAKKEAVVKGHEPNTTLPSQVSIRQSAGEWFAHGGGKCASGRTWADAVNALERRLGYDIASPVEVQSNKRIQNSISFPTFDVIDLHPQPDICGKHRYLLDCCTNVDLTRGDFERIGLALYTSGKNNGRATPDTAD